MLQEGLAGRFRCRIKAGMGILAASWCAILLSIFLSCRPFMNYFAPGLQKPGEPSSFSSFPILCFRYFPPLLAPTKESIGSLMDWGRRYMQACRIAADPVDVLRPERINGPLRHLGAAAHALEDFDEAVEEDWSGYHV